MSGPPPTCRLKFADALLYSKVTPMVMALVRFKVPDLVEGPSSDGSCVGDLASRVGVDGGMLYRTLRFLSSNWDLFEELPGRRFRHSEESLKLRSGEPLFVMTTIQEAHDKAYFAFDKLLMDPSKTGFEHQFGEDYFGSWLPKHPELEARFSTLMSVKATQFIPTMLKAWTPPQEGLLCDLGGSNGHVLAGILEAAPALRGQLFELPSVLTHTKQVAQEQTEDPFLKEFAGKNIFGRMELVEGSFFEEADLARIEPKPDFYFMKWITRVFHEKDVLKLLTALAKTMRKDAKVFICEAIVPDEPNLFRPLLVTDVHMAVAAGGLERTAAEWAVLADSAGFKITNVAPFGDPVCNAVQTLELK